MSVCVVMQVFSNRKLFFFRWKNSFLEDDVAVKCSLPRSYNSKGILGTLIELKPLNQLHTNIFALSLGTHTRQNKNRAKMSRQVSFTSHTISLCQGQAR